jgi:hypothetical protein
MSLKRSLKSRLRDHVQFRKHSEVEIPVLQQGNLLIKVSDDPFPVIQHITGPLHPYRVTCLLATVASPITHFCGFGRTALSLSGPGWPQ